MTGKLLQINILWKHTPFEIWGMFSYFVDTERVTGHGPESSAGVGPGPGARDGGAGRSEAGGCPDKP